MSTHLYPILRIRAPLGEPSHPSFSVLMTSDVKFNEAQAQGGTQNVTRYVLDKKSLDFIGDDDEDYDYREAQARAVSLPYSLQPDDSLNALESWQSVLTTAEAAQLAERQAYYQGQVDALNIEAQSNPLTAAQKQLLSSYQELAAACAVDQNLVGTQCGFLQVVPSIFGLGGMCIRDTNNVPNVDKVRQSTFVIPSDRPWHLAWKFAKPLAGQRETSAKASWGPFVLEFRGGRRVLLNKISDTMYLKNGQIDVDTVSALQAQLDTFLDYGRLTADDMTYIEAQQAAILNLRVAANQAGYKTTDPEYITTFNQIEVLKNNIKVRQKLKQEMPQDIQTQINTIKTQLYSIYDKPVNLNEANSNFYGTEGIVHMTVLPQKRGFLTIVLDGQEPVTFRLPDILKTKAYGTVWPDTLLVLQNNGGGMVWQFLFPTVETTGTFTLPDVPLPFVISDGDVVTDTIECDALSPGTNYTLAINQYIAPNSQGFNPKAPAYDFEITLTSAFDDGSGITNQYLPWLYLLRYDIDAGTVADNSTVLWTTETFGETYTLNPGHPNVLNDNPIARAQYTADDQGDGRRGAYLTIDLRAAFSTIGFPTDGYKGYSADFLVAIYDDVANTVTGIQPYLINGVIRDAVLMKAGSMIDGSTQLAESMWRLSIGDLFSWLDDYELQGEISLDGLTLGAAIQTLLLTTGLPSSYMTGVQTTGDLAGPKLPDAGVGERPRVAPKVGVKIGQYLMTLMAQYGATAEDVPLRLHIVAGVITLDTAGTGSFSLSSDPAIINTAAGIFPIFYEAEQSQDWSLFYNTFVVRGGHDRETRQRISRTMTIFRSIIDPTSPLYLGSVKTLTVDRPDLDTAADVEQAVEILAVRNSRSGNQRHFESMWLYPLPELGDQGTVDTMTLELARLDMIMAPGLPKATITVRKVQPGDIFA